jgi:Na+/proline symporter
MKPFISATAAAFHLVAFAFAMWMITQVFRKKLGTGSISGFLVADRNVSWLFGAFSIAASWTWALALMVSVQMSYEQGFSGIFWFTLPNILAILMYSRLGSIIRRDATKMREGYSLPEWIFFKYRSKSVAYVYLFVFLQYQLMAATVQIYAGAHLLSAATGIRTLYLMPAVLAVTLLYSLVSGMVASVATDFVQMLTMLVFGGLIVAAALFKAGPLLVFSGVNHGGSANPLNPTILLTLGFINSVALFSAGINDQQLWQRCFAIKEKDIGRSFFLGGLTFGAIPIMLSFLGFLAAHPAVGLNLSPGFDKSLVGFAVVNQILGSGWAILFIYALMAGFCSTLDSAILAISALWALIRRRPWEGSGDARPHYDVRSGRLIMLAAGLAGLLIAYLVELLPGFSLKYLFWFYNGICASTMVPTFLALLWDRLTARGILIGSSVSLGVGFPLLFYGSTIQSDRLLALTYLGIVLFSSAACYLTRRKDKNETAYDLQDSRTT